MPTLTFSPTLVVNSQRFALPRPVLSLRILDAWDFTRFKVPLQEGDIYAGRSRNGVDINIEGQIGSQAGQLKTSESAMFLTLEQLRNLAADVQNTDCKLILYHDPVDNEDYLLQACTLIRFEYDLSDAHLFTYSATLHASDPVIHIEPAI